MGAYLAVPIETKESEDVSNEKIICGSSSMQGWRTDQEDAHCCILDFDHNVSLFAVFDGHGGFEVAKYAAQHLPSFIKKNASYKNGDYEKALKEAFMEFDKALLTDSVQEELEKLMNENKKDENDVNEDVASGSILNENDLDEEENISSLYEEAEMPLQKVIDKYRAKFGLSPCIKPKVNEESKASCSKTENFCFSDDTSNVGSNFVTNRESNLKIDDNDPKILSADLLIDQRNIWKASKSSVSAFRNTNDLISTPSCSKNPTTTTKRRSALEFLKRIRFETLDDASSSDEDDKSYKGESSSVSTEDDDVSNNVKKDSKKPSRSSFRCKALCPDDDDDDDDNDNDDDDDSDDDDGVSDDNDDGGENENNENGQNNHVNDDATNYINFGSESLLDFDNENRSDFFSKGLEKPAYNSGCTAVVALLVDNTLYVANAGDSRCIICTNEMAEDLSFDHKPEDEVEFLRITNAGGKVIDGRVNHGLNLSRAFGDHNYKLNKNLSSEEQMITAMPDVKVRNISKDDEFIVLACDGIWNSMSSQQVASFVRMHIHQYDKISTICEEMFDSCLAPNTFTGEGEGCDNMTAVIIKLKSFKRRLSVDDTEVEKDTTDDKRFKIE